jgi:hypothetical protein
MSEFFRGKTYFTCTAKGQLIIEKFVESERDLMFKIERATESALRTGRYEDGCTMVATFEASRVFQRGVGIAKRAARLSCKELSGSAYRIVT